MKYRAILIDPGNVNQETPGTDTNKLHAGYPGMGLRWERWRHGTSARSVAVCCFRDSLRCRFRSGRTANCFTDEERETGIAMGGGRALKLPGMEPADDIRQQDIRRIVIQRLQGFPIRQAIREAIRAKRRKKIEPPKEEQELMFP